MEKTNYTRAELKEIFERMETVPLLEDSKLAESIEHFSIGTPLTEIWTWLELKHKIITQNEEAIVEIQTPGLFWPSVYQYNARSVTFHNGKVFTDEIERKNLCDKEISSLKWISSEGVVYNYGGCKIRGMINGVYMVSDISVINETIPDDEDNIELEGSSGFKM